MEQNINLEEISKIPEPEFRKHFHEWLQNDGVARALQAKLRKDLIENFNKTSLGRKIYSQQIKSQRLMLCPLILAMNTLVAEFLYNQNCHFSLSVFSTEVPYRNTLPDFESMPDYRFSQLELSEIFEAISGTAENEFNDLVADHYINSSDRRSLLYLILKYTFKSSENNQKQPTASTTSKEDLKEAIPPKKGPIPKETKIENADESSTSAAKGGTSRNTFYNNHFRYLNKYLVILSRKVKQMAGSLEQLEKQNNNPSHSRRKSSQTRNFDNINRSLEKVSENLKTLTMSKRKNKKLSAIISAVDKMAKQFERCAYNFDSISKGISAERREKSNLVKDEKSYSDWISDLKTAKSGQKFIAKVESSLRKTLEREKTRMTEAFEARLEDQKELIKLKYKQRLLEQVGKASSKEEDDKTRNSNNKIENKLKELDARHQELLKRVADTEGIIKVVPTVSNLEKELASNAELVQELPRSVAVERSTNTEDNIPNRETEQVITPKIYISPETIKPHFCEVALTIAQHERNIDQIVFDSKLRIKELEYESNQLDRSFQDYLQRQQKQKQNVEESATSVWDNYNIGKSIICKKYASLRNIRQSELLRTRKNLDIDDIMSTLPKIEIVKPSEDLDYDQKPIIFENPFRKLKEDIEKEEWKKYKKKENLNQKNPVKKNGSIKVIRKQATTTENKIDELKNSIEKALNVHVINHDQNHKTKFKPKNVVVDYEEVSRTSSEVNIKELSDDELEISPIRSPSQRSELNDRKYTFRSKRKLFPAKTEANRGDIILAKRLDIQQNNSKQNKPSCSSNVREINHNASEKLKINSRKKLEKLRELSKIPSEINLDDLNLELQQSPSKSSTESSVANQFTFTYQKGDILATNVVNQDLIDFNLPRNGGDGSNQRRNNNHEILESPTNNKKNVKSGINIFQQSSFAKHNGGNTLEKGKQKTNNNHNSNNNNNNNNNNKRKDTNLQIPTTSTQELSSSNSLASFKLNLSVGQTDDNADDFWTSI